MSIYDTMQFIKPDVSTLCMGMAASMGAFLLAAGAKGKRFALPNSRVMIHQPSGGAQGQATDIEIQAREILKTREQLNKIWPSAPASRWRRSGSTSERDYFMSADEAKDYGLIDQVIAQARAEPRARPMSAALRPCGLQQRPRNGAFLGRRPRSLCTIIPVDDSHRLNAT